MSKERNGKEAVLNIGYADLLESEAALTIMEGCMC